MNRIVVALIAAFCVCFGFCAAAYADEVETVPPDNLTEESEVLAENENEDELLRASDDLVQLSDSTMDEPVRSGAPLLAAAAVTLNDVNNNVLYIRNTQLYGKGYNDYASGSAVYKVVNINDWLTYNTYSYTNSSGVATTSNTLKGEVYNAMQYANSAKTTASQNATKLTNLQTAVTGLSGDLASLRTLVESNAATSSTVTLSTEQYNGLRSAVAAQLSAIVVVCGLLSLILGAVVGASLTRHMGVGSHG